MVVDFAAKLRIAAHNTLGKADSFSKIRRDLNRGFAVPEPPPVKVLRNAQFRVEDGNTEFAGANDFEPVGGGPRRVIDFEPHTCPQPISGRHGLSLTNGGDGEMPERKVHSYKDV